MANEGFRCLRSRPSFDDHVLIEAWFTRRTASIVASEPGLDFSSIADREDNFPTVKQNLGTEGSVVGDLEVHESIEVNAKMVDVFMLCSVMCSI